MSSLSFAASMRHSVAVCHCHHVQGEQAILPAARRSFPFSTTTRKYERDRPFAIEHITLDLTLDTSSKAIQGEARLRCRRIDAMATLIQLDAIAFDILRVELVEWVSKRTFMVTHFYDDAVLSIELPIALQEFEIVVSYRAHPKRGLYFLEPDEHVRDRPRQVWSQCQDEDARYWFPCHDKPHIRQTTELRVRVPPTWFALSNGDLMEQKIEGNQALFHWRQNQPHASYLVTLVAGEFIELKGELTSRAKTAVPLTYYIPKNREDDGIRAFGYTADMIALFERCLGVSYPWSKYAQVVVSDFIFGGMENTSATTMFESILLDERAILDVDMNGLVAHELAHQWFGNLVTCRDWSEGWLNEGWATYMELIWKEQGTEPGAGRDEYDYALKGEFDIYQQEDLGRYRRPIVCKDYDTPGDLFDRHLYQKGGLVLHALRCKLGDAAFWSAVSTYLQRYAGSIVETRDFQRILEEASGKSLDRFFDLYVYGAGHPDFEIIVEYHVASSSTAAHVLISVHQNQKIDESTKLYEGPLVFDFSVGGVLKRDVVHVRSMHDSFVIFTSKRPDFIVIDPDAQLIATIESKVPADLLRSQLKLGPTARARWLAAVALAKRDDDKTVEALAQALMRTDEFWGVRVESAEALGEIRNELSFNVLQKAASIQHPKVRRAVVHALGKFKTSAAAETLKPIAFADESYLVQAEAARSLGATRQVDSLDALVEILDRNSWADVVRSGAAEGLANLRDERAVPHLRKHTSYGYPSSGRRASMMALTKIDPSQKTRELLEERLDDRDVFVRTTAVRALEALGDVKARSALQTRLEREDSASVRRRIREALRDLTAEHETEFKRLNEEIERMREETHSLRARLTKLEALKTKASLPKSALSKPNKSSKRSTKK